MPSIMYTRHVESRYSDEGNAGTCLLLGQPESVHCGLTKFAITFP